MGLAEDVAEIGRLIDAYDGRCPACHVIVDGQLPPPEMRGELLSSPGWVECRVLPSTLTLTDVVVLEREYGIEFPPAYRAYLLARFHLHDQVHAHRHDDQLIFWTAVPSRDSFRPLRERIDQWRPLIDAGYIPFAEWGDAWGPMCFDTAQRRPDGECPVVWMDHDLLHRVVLDRCGERQNLEPLAQRLYDSSRELILDVFSIPSQARGTNQ